MGWAFRKTHNGFIEGSTMRLTCNIPPRLMACFHDDDFRIQYLETDNELELWLHGIVGDPMTSTDSLSVGRLLSEHRGKPVKMSVNSPGGLAFDGFSMFNALASHDGPTRAVIEGLAGSAASLAVLGCDHVQCFDGGSYHPHYALAAAFGHAPEIRDTLLILEKMDKELEKVYSARSGRSVEQVKTDLLGPNGDGTPFTATEALEAGYVDEVLSVGRRAAATVPSPVSDQTLRRRKLTAMTRHKELLTVRK